MIDVKCFIDVGVILCDDGGFFGKGWFGIEMGFGNLVICYGEGCSME